MEKNLIYFLKENVSLRVLSVFFAVALWLFVTTEKKNEATLSIPLKIVNLEKGLIVANKLPEEVEVRLVGVRSLLPFILRGNLKLRLDLTGAKPGKGIYDLKYAKLDLPRGVAVKSITPEKINVIVDKAETKDVQGKPML